MQNDVVNMIIIEDCSSVLLYRIICLTNVPMRNYQIELIKRVRNPVTLIFRSIIGFEMPTHLLTE